MKILMVIERYLPIWGGAENQLAQLMPVLKDKGIEISVATRYWDRKLLRRELREGASIIRLGIPGEGQVATVAFIFHLLFYLVLSGKNYDIFHSHGAVKMGVLCRIPAVLFGRKNVAKIATAGKIEKLKTSIFGRILLSFFNKSDLVIGMTHEIRNELVSIGVSGDKIVTIPNGVDCTKFYKENSKSTRVEFRKYHDLPGDAKVAIFVGRLVYRKGVDVLLKAWDTLSQSYTDYYVLVVGSGRMQPDSVEKEIKSYVNDHHIDRVRFIGEIQAIDYYLANSDLFVFPSRKEGFPNALMEAMAAGLPVVVSDIGGNTDLVSDKETGLFFKTGDVEDLNRTLTDAMSYGNNIEKLGISARKIMENQYDFPIIASQYTSLYNQLLGT